MSCYCLLCIVGILLIILEGVVWLCVELYEFWYVCCFQVIQVVSEVVVFGDCLENVEYIYGKKMLCEIDSCVCFLCKCLENLKVVGEWLVDLNWVYFGVWVILEDEDGEQVCYCIVGFDELDLCNNQISIDLLFVCVLVGKELDVEVLVCILVGEKFWFVVEIEYLLVF